MKASEIKKEWLVIDAQNLVLGRLASCIANLLRGKHKPTFTPHMDCGDYVVVINASKVALTGKKLANRGKMYYRHTGHPGGIKETDAKTLMNGKYPERIIKLAVKRMLTPNPLSSQVLSHLYVYPADTHPHEGQMPKPYDFGVKNKKNTKKSV
ncbi:50S ribosomal protein L13 [Rickettsiales endosymbiont of Paramecium tredecaurelia]|nr:50S ribosomal protein L13 [Candidatus Sarmatiella mevalonica]